MSPKYQFAALNRIAAGKSIGAADTIAEYLAGPKKFARPNVMSSSGDIGLDARYVSRDDKDDPYNRNVVTGETTMQKALIILGATLIAAVTVQSAAASDRHHVRKAYPAAVTQSIRNSNAAIWPSQPVEPDWSRYANGAMSAPAGR